MRLRQSLGWLIPLLPQIALGHQHSQGRSLLGPFVPAQPQGGLGGAPGQPGTSGGGSPPSHGLLFSGLAEEVQQDQKGEHGKRSEVVVTANSDEDDDEDADADAAAPTESEPTYAEIFGDHKWDKEAAARRREQHEQHQHQHEHQHQERQIDSVGMSTQDAQQVRQHKPDPSSKFLHGVSGLRGLPRGLPVVRRPSKRRDAQPAASSSNNEPVQPVLPYKVDNPSSGAANPSKPPPLHPEVIVPSQVPDEAQADQGDCEQHAKTNRLYLDQPGAQAECQD